MAVRIKPAPGVDDTIFKAGDQFIYLTVVEELQDITDWSILSILLGVSDADVNRMRQNNPNDVKSKEQAIIKAWIGTGKASWAYLVSALKDRLVNQVAYANQIAEKYPKGSDTVAKSSSSAASAQADVSTSDVPAKEMDQELVDVKKKQIEARLSEPEFQKAQGIIFIVGVYGADGTALDVANVEKTFRELKFATFVVRDPPAKELACLMQAAAEMRNNYPYKCQYIAFYFAGHGGTDTSTGKMYVVGLQTDGSDKEILPVEEYIIDPLKCLEERKISRLFFFDCCQSPGQGTEFRGVIQKKPKPYAGELIAYATNKGEKSWGDRKNGGIWTYHFCKNLRECDSDIVNILAKTTDDVINARETFQHPLIVSSLGIRKLK